MKKIIMPALLAIAITTISCNNKKTDSANATTDTTLTEAVDSPEAVNDTVAAEEDNAPVTVTVKGKVMHIVPGKDGYMAEITDDSGITFFTTISIPNMKDPKQYKQVKIGDVITVKGESWKMDDEMHIKVEELQ